MGQYKNVQERLKAQQAAAEAKARGELVEPEEDDELHPLTKMFMQGNFKGSYDENAVETGNYQGWNLNDFR